MVTFNQGGSVNIDTTGKQIEFDQKHFSYSILNLSTDDIFIKFNGADVTANKTVLGEGKLWLITNMGVDVPSDVRKLFAKTAAGTSDLLVVRNERDE